MAADYRMIAVNIDATRAQSVVLTSGWVSAMCGAGIELRTADVGEVVLSKIAALTIVEAARVNTEVRRSAQEVLRAKGMNDVLAYLQKWDLECADRVADLIAFAGQARYFQPWILVELADID